MKYNTKFPLEVTRAKEYFEQLLDKQAIIEVKKVSPKRSLNQNSYLHLLLAAFAAHLGESPQRAKTVYKGVNKDIYFRKIKVGEEEFLHIRSSADLTKDEMTKSIERFREFSATELDYPLPSATDQGWLQELENAVEQQSRYL